MNKVDKKQKPLISVVMPAHNSEKYINLAIESILTQTFKNFELIIVNDASTDKTAEIISSYARNDPRIEVITNKERRDIAESLNRGIEKAHSNLIARMDADDIAFPNRLDVQYEAITRTKNTAVVGANILLINTEGEDITTRKYPTSSKALKSCLFRYSPFAHPVVVFRKDFFDEVGQYNPKYSPTEDLDLWFRLGMKHDFESVPQLLLKYRLNEKSSSHSILKHVELLVFEIRWNAATKYNYRPSPYDIFYNLLQFITLWVTPAKYRIKIYNMLINNDLI